MLSKIAPDATTNLVCSAVQTSKLLLRHGARAATGRSEPPTSPHVDKHT
jgi:hypothetical protein